MKEKKTEKSGMEGWTFISAHTPPTGKELLTKYTFQIDLPKMLERDIKRMVQEKYGNDTHMDISRIKVEVYIDTTKIK